MTLALGGHCFYYSVIVLTEVVIQLEISHSVDSWTSQEKNDPGGSDENGNGGRGLTRPLGLLMLCI